MLVKKFVVGDFLTNCYILQGENSFFLIDPGSISKELKKELKETKKELKAIICTHYHFDHVSQVKKIKQMFPEAKVMIEEHEKDYIEHYFDDREIDIVLGPPSESRTKIEKATYANFQVDHFLKDGEKIILEDDEFTVFLTPGHSPGSICFLNENIAFVGDTLFEDGVGRTDLLGGDEKDLQSSLELLRNILKPGMQIYPGHGNEFVFVKQNN